MPAKRTALKPEDWIEIFRRKERGESVLKIAKRFKITPAAIYNRAFKEGRSVRTPQKGRNVVQMDAAAPLNATNLQQEAPQQSLTTSPTSPQPSKNQLVTPKPDFYLALENLATAPPEQFQQAFVAVCQQAISKGIRDVEPPRNVSELKTWVELLRKAANLDQKEAPQARAPLVNPQRRVGRRAGGFGVMVDVGGSEPVIEPEAESMEGLMDDV